MTSMERGCRTLLPAVIVLLLAVFTPCALAQRADTVIERFDVLVGKGLPAVMELPANEQPGHSQRIAKLLVSARLRSTAAFPGESPSALYDALLDGDAAVVTRSPWGLDVTVLTADGTWVIVATQGAPAVTYTRLVEPYDTAAGPGARRSPADFHDDVESGGGPLDPPSFADSTAPISIRIFLHDEMRSTQARSIHAGYVAWWLKDMESNVLPGEKIEVTYLQAIPGISDLGYGSETTLPDWNRRVNAYVESRGIRRTWKNKYVLVTQHPPSPGKLGQAIPALGVAIATVSGPYSTIAHELGHTFGAEHRFAETRTGSWWGCRTTMASPHLGLLANCYVYSAGNMASIRRHVALRGHLPPQWRLR